MSLDTFKGMQDYVLQMAGMAGVSRRGLCKEWVNRAHQEVCEAHDWEELDKSAWLATVAPYTTGTITATQGDATIVGVGTTFTSAMAGRKIAPGGIGNPWFLISTYTDGTNLEMERAWDTATESGVSYSIYEDVYSLASDVDKLWTDKVTLHDDDGHLIGRLSQRGLLEARDLPTATGRPEFFALIENDTLGRKQIQLGHRAPDTIYVIRYHYKRRHVEMVADGSEPLLPPSLHEVVCAGALARAYQMPEFLDTGLYLQQTQKFEHELAKKIRQRRAEGPSHVAGGTFDGVGAQGRLKINWPVAEN